MKPYLFVAAVLSLGLPAKADELSHVGTFEVVSDSFVGLSGLEVSDDGASFSVISDAGWYLAGEFERMNGEISGLTLTKFLPILGNDGLPVAARRLGDWSDAEGLAIADDGTHWISFERWAHVSRFEAPELTGQWIEDHPTFYEYSENRQLEALAIHPDGTLYTFPEKPLREGFPIYRLAGDKWTIDGHIPQRNRFSIVGADFDDNGDLYVLERKLALGLWWQSRIRRFESDLSMPDEVLWSSQRGEYLNLEGIAVWKDERGTRLTLVSDNNGKAGAPSQFVEFRID